jgi:NhaA family Na+:H+ antiporter
MSKREDKDTPAPEFPAEPIDVVATPFQRFIHTESLGGIVLLLAAILALLIANSTLGPYFEAFWTMATGVHIGPAAWDFPLRHWINDGLVTLFFFVVGLEIKREVAYGELSSPGAATLPIVAAVGGMVVPAALYLALTSGPEASAGWGVVMATDIAFVVGCLALLGKRVPDSLRAFVLALAIIDDIGAILVIAIGYSSAFHLLPFAGAVLGLGVTFLMQRLGVRPVLAYWFVGLLIWLALHESGIHPTIAGVALGLLTPVRAWIDEERLDRFLRWATPAGDKPDQPRAQPDKTVRSRIARAARESISPQQRLEDGLHPWSAFFVLPLFALANAGVVISLAGAFDSITLAIIVGLAVGKPLGIFGFSWLAVKLGLARKPTEYSWAMLFAAGSLAGIGFTMSLFIGNLAFGGDALQSAKLGILIASLISAAAGMTMFWFLSARKA